MRMRDPHRISGTRPFRQQHIGVNDGFHRSVCDCACWHSVEPTSWTIHNIVFVVFFNKVYAFFSCLVRSQLYTESFQSKVQVACSDDRWFGSEALSSVSKVAYRSSLISQLLLCLGRSNKLHRKNFLGFPLLNRVHEMCSENKYF